MNLKFHFGMRIFELYDDSYVFHELFVDYSLTYTSLYWDLINDYLLWLVTVVPLLLLLVLLYVEKWMMLLISIYVDVIVYNHSYTLLTLRVYSDHPQIVELLPNPTRNVSIYVWMELLG